MNSTFTLDTSSITHQTTLPELMKIIAQVYIDKIRPEGGSLKGGIILSAGSPINEIYFGSTELRNSMVLMSQGYAIAQIVINPDSHRMIRDAYNAIECKTHLAKLPEQIDMTPIKVVLPACS